jgi:membrane fusion protein (multidrug efflux system)
VETPHPQGKPPRSGFFQKIASEFAYFFALLRTVNWRALLSKLAPPKDLLFKLPRGINLPLPPQLADRFPFKILKSARLPRFPKLPIVPILAWGVAIAVVVFVSKTVFLAPKKEAKEKKPAAAAEKEPEVLPVKVFKVARFNYEDSLNALGTVKGGIEFKLSFEIPGVINSINYREGERYEEGALLVSLKQDDILIRLKRAQAERNKAETALSLAKEKYKEHETLFKIGAIPPTTLDKVKLEVESAEYDLEGASLEVKLNEAMLEKSNLYAPTDGMIGVLYIEEGETVTPNTLLGSHVSTDVVFAEFGVVERDVAKLALGQNARVYVDAYPDKTFEGVVENVSPVVTGTSRTATARVRVENPESILLPGMFARIKILLYSKRNALVVPTDAVQGKEEETSVFVVNPRTNKVAKRNIKIGYTRPDYSQVDAGLEEGELVCVSGLEKLKEGIQVKVVEQQQVEL